MKTFYLFSLIHIFLKIILFIEEDEECFKGSVLIYQNELFSKINDGNFYLI